MKQNFLLLATILFTIIGSAQTKEETKSQPSRIKVYTPTSSVSKSSSKDNSYKWAVKTDLLGFLTGEFPIIGEYRLGNKFSVEASAGVTYAFIPNEFSLSGEDEFESNYDSKPAMGTAFRGTFKFYPSSDYDAIEGWNFGIQLFSKTTNREYDITDSSGTYDSLNGLKDTKTKTGVSLIIGKQVFQDSNVTFESFIGIGFAKVKREYYSQNYDYDTDTSYNEKFETEDSVPNFQLGFRIGFGN